MGRRRPRVVSEFPRLRNGVEDPAQLAGVHVKRANVTGRSGQRLGNAAPENEEVFEDRARRAGAHAQPLGGLAQSLAQIDPALIAEGGHGLACFAVERPQKTAVRHEDAIVVNGDAAVARACARTASARRVERPHLTPGSRVDRSDAQRRRRDVEHAAHHDRVALHLRAAERILRVVGPRDLQLTHVGAGDLGER